MSDPLCRANQRAFLPSQGKRLGWVWMALSVWLVASGGCAPSETGFKVQFADASLLARVKFLDIAIYPGSKVKCAQLNSTNYTKAGPFGADLVGEYPIDFKSEEKSGVVETLPEGSDLVLYFLGLELVGTEKKSIAQGCVSGITLKTGEIAPVNVTLEPLP